jgi:redox-sensitive bicupin YhaK (pirin superfamily)
MANRSVQYRIPAQKVNMGGHLLDQPLPIQQLEQLDPFLLIHHWKNEFPGGQKENEVGVGPHPHRGFSPVTFVYEGEVVHRDSLGEKASVSSGGTQWMFAGRGITHSERMGKEIAENGGLTEFIQFWVNAPAADKMKAPFYKPISQEETPLVIEGNSKIYVVSGDFKGTQGVAPTYSPQLLLRGELAKGDSVTFPVPQDFNALFYLLDGEVEVEDNPFVAKDMIVFNNDGDEFTIKAKETTRFMMLSGEPLNEPLVSYGPFVLNNQTQVMEAIRDAQTGKMGILIEEFD